MKRALIFALACLTLLLSGCGMSDEEMDEIIREQSEFVSGITENQDYKTAVEKKQQGELQEDGKVKVDVTESAPPSGKVRVTFATNAYLDIAYYADEGCTVPLDLGKCWLNPGDTIYTAVNKVQNPYSSKYAFQEYRVYEYDSDGKRKLLQTCAGDSITIPAEYEGTDISIMPVGELSDRTLQLEDFIVDKDGKETPVNGTWKVDDNAQKSTDRESITISPTASYTLYYYFDTYKDAYYFESSEPAPFTVDDAQGIVVFQEESPMDGCESFRVRLKPYVTVKLANKDYNFLPFWPGNGAIMSVTRNGTEESTQKSAEVVLSKVRAGDRFRIQVKPDYQVTVQGTGISVSSPITLADSYEYVVEILENPDSNLGITVSRTSSTHGNFVPRTADHIGIAVMDSHGTVLGAGNTVEENENVTVVLTAEDGYYLTGKGLKDGTYTTTLKYSKYCTDIDEILHSHAAKKYIVVKLNNTDSYGDVTYLLGGKEVTGTLNLREDEKLEVKFVLADETYEIVRDGFMDGLLNRKEKTVQIPLSAALDGKTIQRSDYIQIQKKGG